MRDISHYITAIAFLAAAVSMLVHTTQHRTHRPFWITMAGVFFLFAILKVVPLVPETSNAARNLSRDAGVYTERRAVQRLAVGVIALASAVGLGALLTYARPTPRELVPLIAATAVVAFAAIRWTSLHQVDSLIHGMPWLVIVVESVAAMMAGLAPHRRVKSPASSMCRPRP